MDTLNYIRTGVVVALLAGAAIGAATAAPGPARGGALVVGGHEASKPGGPAHPLQYRHESERAPNRT
jgi:hypothetical protein